MGAELSAPVVILGAGIAGLSAAETLRRLEPETEILLINGEDRPPYKRTKISKHLAEGFGLTDFSLKDEDWYAAQGLTRLDGWRVTSIDPVTRTVQGGPAAGWPGPGAPRGGAAAETLRAGRLLIALGSAPEGAALGPVFREAADADRLGLLWRSRAQNAGPLHLLGAGATAVELAEQAARLGHWAVLVCPSGRPLSRTLTPAASARLAGLLAAQGITVEALKGPAEAGAPYDAVAAGNRARWPALLSAGEGAGPGGPALGPERQIGPGGQTSWPGVWVAGDGCPDGFGGTVHLWHQAEAQGVAAAFALAGLPIPEVRPWRLKLEVFGDYYWVMHRRPPDQVPAPWHEEQAQGVYRAWTLHQGRLQALVMAGDRDRAKTYERAVLEAWSPETLRRELPL